jgi:methylthioribulose 1-phosphate dehydratase / enolase-phosphatase E1
MSTNGASNNDATPGHGWTNGALDPRLYSQTIQGKLQLYSQERRWIGLNTGWTRIGAGASEQDARHSSSQAITTEIPTDPKELADYLDRESITVRGLMAQLCEVFYKHGWATGTGGGVSIRVGGQGRPWRVFVAPSGIQKEDLIGNDIFELDMDRKVVVPPATPHLRQSACTPLWYVVYKYRPSATCVIHTHSMHAQMATLLDTTETSKVLRLTHLEMLKGVGNHAYDDVLEVPIIDNRPTEDQLADQLEEAIQLYPKCNAVLVRRHGLYVWGDSWEQAKTQCESFDYLFQSAVLMKHQMGVDPSVPPLHGTYRPDADGSFHEPPRKTLKTGFHGMGAKSNATDLSSNTVPILPRDAKILVLDIEGCTTSIAYVHDELFPYIRRNVQHFVDEHFDAHSDEYKQLCQGLAKEVEETMQPGDQPMSDDLRTNAVALVHYLMDRDVKSATLKGLQGKMWNEAFTSHEIHGHVYSDLKPMLEWMQEHKVPVYIYSSGSILAQKLHFGHSVEGNLLSLLSGHFDIPAVGGKKEAESYRKIAEALHCDPTQIVFVSDAEAELVAAKEAQIGWPVMSIRPGNAPLTEVGQDFPRVFSLLQLCGN